MTEPPFTARRCVSGALGSHRNVVVLIVDTAAQQVAR